MQIIRNNYYWIHFLAGYTGNQNCQQRHDVMTYCKPFHVTSPKRAQQQIPFLMVMLGTGDARIVLQLSKLHQAARAHDILNKISSGCSEQPTFSRISHVVHRWRMILLLLLGWSALQLLDLTLLSALHSMQTTNEFKTKYARNNHVRKTYEVKKLQDKKKRDPSMHANCPKACDYAERPRIKSTWHQPGL